jgi:hypothetical protein
MILLRTTRPRRFVASMSTAVSTAVLLCTIAASEARAVPLDKLTGGGVIVAGNVVFSNFQAPSFVGMGPSAVDVQGIALTDNTGAQIGANLRFTPVDGKGVNPLVQCATCGGSKELVMNTIFQVNVTDRARLLDGMAHQMLATSTGANAVIYDSTVSSFVSLGAAAASLSPLSGILVNCIGSSCLGSGTPLSTLLSSDSTYAFVNQQVQMLVSGKNGQSTGRNVLAYYDVIFTEVPAL